MLLGLGNCLGTYGAGKLYGIRGTGFGLKIIIGLPIKQNNLRIAITFNKRLYPLQGL